jgi:WD40 repeat protein/energy-coupling factor transporter ATP-binding protein EcfA2
MVDIMRQTNPFPGIRSFESSEDHLFFGREKQVEEVAVNLFHTQFAAIIGSSGCGKSSLVKAGLIPMLFKHKHRKLENDWSLTLLRPGDDPIGNMATALYHFYADNNGKHTNKLSKDEIKEILFKDSKGLVNIIRDQDKQHKRNRLIIIDQFEEIFRYRNNEALEHLSNDAIHFVNLFLHAINSKEEGIYVVLTMRSDFLGDCTEYTGLAEAINMGHYLVPRMTEKEKEKAIVGPILAMDGDISDDLLSRLLDDVGDNPDQLPVMQHALMRTWDYWMINKTQNQLIGIDHYEAIGGMQSALSLHAEEIYTELADTESRKITEKLFKALTDLGIDNKGTRRPTQLQELLALTSATEEQIIAVIDAFRAPGRAFLMPPPQEKISLDSIIDISHESIMRVWVRLKEWVDEETKSADLYLRLSKSAELYQKGNTGLWVNPELQLALHWQTQNKPNAIWAMRYDPAFDRAINFLEYSKKQYDLEIAHKERKQKRELKRTKLFAMFLGTASIVSILFLIVSLNLRFKAEASEKLALEKEKLAIIESKKASEQRKEAIIQKKISEQQQQIAEQQKIITEEQKQYAVKQQMIAVDAKDYAVLQKAKAESAKTVAIKAKDEAERQKTIAVKQKQIANEERINAEKSEKNAQHLRMLALAKSVAIKATELNNQTKGDLPRLLALHAYYMNKTNGGTISDPDIFNALLNVSQSTKVIHGHKDAVRSIDISPDGKYIASTSGDDIKIWDFNAKAEKEIQLKKLGLKEVRCLSYNPQGKGLAAGSISGDIYYWNQNHFNENPLILKAHKQIINKLDFSNDGEKLASVSNDGSLRLWDLNTTSPSSIVLDSSNTRINVIKFNKESNLVAYGKQDGIINIYTLDQAGNQAKVFKMPGSQILSLAFSNDGNSLIAGNSNGQIWLWNIEDENAKPIEFIGHTSGVTAISIMPHAKIFASSSYDGSIRIWNYEKPEIQPVIINDHDSWVYDLSFSPDGKTMVSAAADKSIRIWIIRPSILSEMICNSVSRSLTSEEWDEYFGNDIPRENPCENKDLGINEKIESP